MYIATRRARLEAREAGFLVLNKRTKLKFSFELNFRWAEPTQCAKLFHELHLAITTDSARVENLKKSTHFVF